ncbi:hypothetical protein NIES22_00440 [Calothrix brevissima NIES-22]|nr:hypothetical protein NIES22_00440 [Calothrix brevissima NIES-22]
MKVKKLAFGLLILTISFVTMPLVLLSTISPLKAKNVEMAEKSGLKVTPAANNLPLSRYIAQSSSANSQSDILWHNSSTGETQIWLMNSYKVASRATVIGENGRPTAIGSPWSIVGVGDINSDRKSDIIWHNSSTGETQIWLMNGYKVTSRATVIGEDGRATAIGSPWNIVGSGDINSDGKSDIIWHNSSTGETQIWLMNGSKVASRATVIGEDGRATAIGSPWNIVGSGDINRNGKADIIWHNSSTGETQIWLMNGSKVASRATVIGEDGRPTAIGSPWSIVGFGVFNRRQAID